MFPLHFLLSILFSLASFTLGTETVNITSPKLFDSVSPVLANAPLAPRAVLATQPQQLENPSTAGEAKSARGSQQPTPLVPLVPLRVGQFVLPRGVNGARAVPSFRTAWNVAGGAGRAGRGPIVGPDGSIIRPDAEAIALLTNRAARGGFFRQPIIGTGNEGVVNAIEKERGEKETETARKEGEKRKEGAEERKEWRNGGKIGDEKGRNGEEVAKTEELKKGGKAAEEKNEWEKNTQTDEERRDGKGTEGETEKNEEKEGKGREEKEGKNKGRGGQEKEQLEGEEKEKRQGKEERTRERKGDEAQEKDGEEELIIEEEQKEAERRKNNRKEQQQRGKNGLAKRKRTRGGGRRAQLVVKVSGGKVILDRNTEGPAGEEKANAIPCGNRAQNCAENSDFCADGNYQKLMAFNCAKTCNFCPQDPKNRLTVPPGLKFPDVGETKDGKWANECRDLSARCQFWTQHGFCESRLFHRDLKQRFCARSCGLCQLPDNGKSGKTANGGGAEAKSTEEEEE